MVDAVGNIYVADYSNDLIRKITPVGTNWVVSTIAGKALVFGKPARPFFDSNPGLAGFQAGPESTSVRMGGAGEDPLVVENRMLRNENARDNAEIIRLLAQLVAAGIKPNVASAPRVTR